MSGLVDSTSNSFQPAKRILLNFHNFFVWLTLIKSELDNIGCVDVVGDNPTKLTPEKERKGYHLIVRYLSKEVLGYFSSVLKPEDEGKASVAWKILKEKFA